MIRLGDVIILHLELGATVETHKVGEQALDELYLHDVRSHAKVEKGGFAAHSTEAGCRVGRHARGGDNEGRGRG